MIRGPRAEPSLDAPCVRECCLDDADVCIGCGRTLDEIKAWHAADGPARGRILEAAAARRQARRDAPLRAPRPAPDDNVRHRP